MPSSRANAQRYGGGVPQHSGPSLMSLIAAASGYNETEGGPQLKTMPDGTQKWDYTPVTAKKKGFLSRWGTGADTASSANLEIGGNAYLQQQKAEQQKEIEKLHAELEKEIGKDAADRAMQLMIRKEQEARETKRKEQAGQGALAAGVIPNTDRDVTVAAEALNDPTIRNRLARTQLDTEVATSPEALAGHKAKEFAPVVENFRNAALNTAPSNVTTVPPANMMRDFGNMNAWPQIVGQQPTQTISPTTKPFNMKTPAGEFSYEMPGEPKVTTSFKPSYIRQPANPDLLRQAQTIQAPNMSLAPQDQAPTMDPELMRMILQMMQQQQGR